MTKLRFTDSQIMDPLNRVESGLAVPEICSELGVSTATFASGLPGTAGWTAMRPSSAAS
jgi:hypothetical protein